MALYLVQHALASSKGEDPQQPITAVGKSQAELIASVAKGYKVKVDQIIHSHKQRTKQTAEIMAQALCPTVSCQEVDGLAPLDDPISFSQQLSTNENLMVVGHLPFLSKLTSQLICRNVDITVFRFQNSGIVCLDQDEHQNWHIKWALMPTIG